MRAYPGIRASKPRKWFFLANLIPCVQVYARVTFIGFWRSPSHVFAPRLEGWAIRLNHGGRLWRRNSWNVPRIQMIKIL